MTRIYTWMQKTAASGEAARRRAERDRQRLFEADEKRREEEAATGRIRAHIGGARPGVIRQVGGRNVANHYTLGERHYGHPNDAAHEPPTARTPFVDYDLSVFDASAFVDLFGSADDSHDSLGAAVYRYKPTPLMAFEEIDHDEPRDQPTPPERAPKRPEMTAATALEPVAAAPSALTTPMPEWGVTYPAGALLLGNIHARGSCMIGSSAEMTGALTTGGVLAIGDHASISGPIAAGGHITVGIGVELGPVQTMHGITAAPSPGIHLRPKRSRTFRSAPPEGAFPVERTTPPLEVNDA